MLLPRDTPAAYHRAFSGLNAKVEMVTGDILSAEREARERAENDGAAEFASPYNDVEVIAGHGTLGVEISASLKPRREIDVFCATGGGGLASGLKLGLLTGAANVRVHAVYPSASPVLARGVERGYVIEEKIGPTMCRAIAGNLERDTVTVSLCSRLVDSFIAVEESEIELARERIVSANDLHLDTSAAAAVAGMLKAAPVLEPGSAAVTIICAKERTT